MNNTKEHQHHEMHISEYQEICFCGIVSRHFDAKKKKNCSLTEDWGLQFSEMWHMNVNLGSSKVCYIHARYKLTIKFHYQYICYQLTIAMMNFQSWPMLSPAKKGQVYSFFLMVFFCCFIIIVCSSPRKAGCNGPSICSILCFHNVHGQGQTQPKPV